MPTAAQVLFDPARRWRVKYEPTADVERSRKERESLRLVPCAWGGPGAHLFVHSTTHLAFTGVGSYYLNKLLTLSDIIPHQTGDEEFTVIFLAERLDRVAKMIKPRRKKSAASAANLRKVTKPPYRSELAT